MARKAMVTRTIVTTKVEVLCMDLVEKVPVTKGYTLPRTYKNDEAILKQVAGLTGDSVKAVSVLNKTEVETLYGMSEQDFISNAQVLDPETRKAFESEAE